ncbi:hypothetical protein C3L33_22520, partial [Rhododendron williamsianum]
MQAQKSAPPDMVCKDKFLVQSTVVPEGTTDEDINTSMFAKDDGRYIEEDKLTVILVSPPNSPVLSPINGTLKQVSAYEASTLKDQIRRKTVIDDVEWSNTENREEVNRAKDGGYNTMKVVEEPAKDTECTTMKDVEERTKYVECKPTKDVEYITTKDVEAPIKDAGYIKMKDVEEPTKDAGYVKMKDLEELKLVKDIEDMKSKLNELDSKLSEAEVTISKLTEERRWTAQETEGLRQELALLRSKKDVRKVQVGFPFLFVCMVAVISVLVGYLLNR